MFPNDYADDNRNWEWEPEYIPPEPPEMEWESDPLWSDYPNIDPHDPCIEQAYQITDEEDNFEQLYAWLNTWVNSIYPPQEQ